jgi:hypothetical protein
MSQSWIRLIYNELSLIQHSSFKPNNGFKTTPLLLVQAVLNVAGMVPHRVPAL